MKRVCFFVILVVILFFYGSLFNVFKSKAYSYKTTHPLLTKEIVDLYNERFDNIITEEDSWWIMRGSSLEDKPLSRTVNHFFDPINGKGLNGKDIDWLSPVISVIESFIVSNKEWANNAAVQANFPGEAYKNNALNPYARLTKDPIDSNSTFTWDKAIYLFLKGERKKAFECLGHILHLLEDLGVPAHTRNDPHLLGDPYEKWASKFAPGSLDISSQLTEMSPKIFFSMEEYFDNLATYSNYNFFSSDSIGLLKYNNPQIDFINSIVKDGYKYIYNEDEFGKYLLVRLGKYNLNLSKLDITIDDEKIHQDYWYHLSRQTVLHGAGLLNLFFKEVDRYKDDKNFIKINEEKNISVIGKKIADIFAALSKNDSSDSEENQKDYSSEVNQESVIDKIELVKKNEFEENENFIKMSPSAIDYNKENKNTPTVYPSPTPVKKTTPTPSKKPVIKKTPPYTPSPKPKPSVTVSPTPDTDKNQSKVVNWCSQGNYTSSQYFKKIIINEIAWAGTANSSADEWIELKNVSNNSINIKNWQLLDKNNQIKIYFDQKGKDINIGPGEFFLLERTDDNSLPYVSADLIFSGGINNNEESLRLFSSDCGIVDEILANPDWPAGNSKEKRSMEKSRDLKDWQTYYGSGNKGILGTPKAENSIPPYVSSSPPPIITPTPTPEIPPSDDIPSQSGSILISEFFFDAEGEDEGFEFIELYNPTLESLNLDGWLIKLSKGIEEEVLVKFGSKKEDNLTISGRGFLLIGLNNYNNLNYSGVSADLIRSASLKQSDEYEYTIKLIDKNSKIVDSISYSNKVNLPGESLERKASQNSTTESMSIGGNEEKKGNGYDTNSKNDFIIRHLPQPQNSISSPEPQDPPPKIVDINGEVREVDDVPVLKFSMDSSTTTKTKIIFKYSKDNSETENNWDDMNELEFFNLEKIGTKKWKTELKLAPGKYYFLARTIDSWGLKSDLSQVYELTLPSCNPIFSNSGHHYIRNVSFYSCLGQNWLSFRVVDFPEPIPIDVKSFGIYFFKNKIEKEVCHDKERCFKEFSLSREDSLGIVGWGGKSIGDLKNKKISSVFIGSNNNNMSDLDFILKKGEDFNFKIGGVFNNNQLNDSNFQESDYIVPVFLSWSGNNPWWKRLGNGANDIVKFQINPRGAIIPFPKDISVVYDEYTKKFIFNTNIEGKQNSYKYEIRYLNSTIVNELNWDKSIQISKGTLNSSGNIQILVNASSLAAEKKYFFGIRFKSGNKESNITKAESFVPFSLLSCSNYSNDLICDSFDDYENGSLSGQNGWIGSGKFEVSNKLGKRESKALVAKTKNDTVTISKNFPSAADKGSISLWVKRSNDRSYPSVSINSGGISKAFIDPFDDKIYLIDGGAKVDYKHTILSPGGWQKWFFKWDKEFDKYWFKVDGFDWQEMKWSTGETGAKGISLTASGYNDVLFEEIRPEVF